MPDEVVPAIRTANKQLEFGISGSPKSAYVPVNLAFPTGIKIDALNRVAVIPKLPAVPVLADRVIVLTLMMYLPESPDGIKLFKAIILEARTVPPTATTLRLPEELS
jgi:hypothetical protein